MTIAIAATFPWGNIGRALKALPGGEKLGGIVLVSDSRWTYPDGSYKDIGQKVWPLLPEQGIAAVFAGDVPSAEEAMRKIGTRLRLLPRLDPKLISETACFTLQQVYAAHRQKRGNTKELQVLLGLTDGRAYCGIVRLESSQAFTPHHEEDVQVVGWPSARATFEEKRAELAASFLNGTGQSLKVDIREWSGHLVQTLFDEVIEPGNEPTVGGGIQIATMDRRGWNECRVGYLDLDGDNEWHQVSVFPTEMSQYVRDNNLPPLAWNVKPAPPRAKARR